MQEKSFFKSFLIHITYYHGFEPRSCCEAKRKNHLDSIMQQCVLTARV